MKKTTVLIAMMAASVAAPAASQSGSGYYPGGGRDGRGQPSITLYEGPDFTGRYITFNGNITNLPRQFNDRAMSVRVRGAWRLCVDSDFRGGCTEVNRDVRDLRQLGLARTISSMQVAYGGGYGGPGGPGGGYGGGYGGPGGPGGGYGSGPGGGYGGPGGGWGRVTLFEGPNFSGRSVSFDRDITNLPREFNDRAASVRVQGRWLLCENSDFRGRCVEVDGDVRDLRAIGLDRSISSMNRVGGR